MKRLPSLLARFIVNSETQGESLNASHFARAGDKYYDCYKPAVRPRAVDIGFVEVFKWLDITFEFDAYFTSYRYIVQIILIVVKKTRPLTQKCG